MNSLVAAARVHLLLQWKSYLIATIGLLVIGLAIADGLSAFDNVHENYREFLSAKAEYATNGMNFRADLAKPAKVVEVNGGEATSNIARSSYDALSHSIDAMSPWRAPEEVLKYLGIFLFPAVFFLFAAQVASYDRRLSTERYGNIRMGSFRATVGRQLAVLIFMVSVAVLGVLVDAATRAILSPDLSSEVPTSKFPDLSTLPSTNWIVAAPLLLLVWVFYTALGFVSGTAFKNIAGPAVVFLVYNYVLPVAGVFDPRTWVAVLARGQFDYSTGSFAIFSPAPMAPALCVSLLLGAIFGAWGLTVIIGARRASIR